MSGESMMFPRRLADFGFRLRLVLMIIRVVCGGRIMWRIRRCGIGRRGRRIGRDRLTGERLRAINVELTSGNLV